MNEVYMQKGCVSPKPNRAKTQLSNAWGDRICLDQYTMRNYCVQSWRIRIPYDQEKGLYQYELCTKVI